jgi:hypothetical protein
MTELRAGTTTGGRVHRWYQTWASGDGAKTVFALSHRIGRADDLLVFVGGALKRPKQLAAAHDFTWTAQQPTIVTMAVAPGAGVDVCFLIAAP